jgi:hypothetical protein
MTVPYPLYSAGMCFLMYLPFYFICDVKGWRIPHLTVLGMNCLVLYLVQQALGDMHGSLVVSEEAGVGMAVFGFVVFYLVCYAVAWRLYKGRLRLNARASTPSTKTQNPPLSSARAATQARGALASMP